jgi:hypothetical protein
MIAITIFIGGFTLCFAVPALHGIAGHSRPENAKGYSSFVPVRLMGC